MLRQLLIATGILAGFALVHGCTNSSGGGGDGVVAAPGSSAVLTIQGDRLLMNGEEIDLWGVRVASALFDQDTTDQLIDQLDDYVEHGVNGLAVFYQGSSGGAYEPFSPDGLTLDEDYQDRMEQIIGAAAERDMIVIAGLFYQKTSENGADFALEDQEAIENAVRTVTRALIGFDNVIINIANEQNSNSWADEADDTDFDFRDEQNLIHLCSLVHEEDPERLCGAGGYDDDKNEVLGLDPEIDILLFDTSGFEDSGAIYDTFVAAGIDDKPIINVELFGGITKNFLPPGVFPPALENEYEREADAAHARPGLSIFFHNNPWMQGPSVGSDRRFDLAGPCDDDDPGVHCYFDYVQDLVNGD